MHLFLCCEHIANNCATHSGPHTLPLSEMSVDVIWHYTNKNELNGIALWHLPYFITTSCHWLFYGVFFLIICVPLTVSTVGFYVELSCTVKKRVIILSFGFEKGSKGQNSKKDVVFCCKSSMAASQGSNSVTPFCATTKCKTIKVIVVLWGSNIKLFYKLT